jgi:acetyl esterase/lipase
LDSLAAYLYLISPPEGIAPIAASDIILMGDSAGGGMCLSLLQLIREMGLPMPAAASLMSPWVDLTHSMPSIMEWDGGDYIPSVGFHYKPSAAWPPTPGDGVTVTMPDGEDKLIDEQIQLYWCVLHTQCNANPAAQTSSSHTRSSPLLMPDLLAVSVRCTL